MKIARVLVVYKKSSYQAHALDRKDRNFLRLLKEGNVAIRRSKNAHDIHTNTLETIKQNLKNLNVPFDVRLRYNLPPLKGYDLVLTIGGDGTFLETSRYVHEGLILGINSVPEESVGHFCHATADNFLEKFYQLVNGKGRARIQTLHRLKWSIDGTTPGPLALNDILFSNQNPAGTTRYIIQVGKRSEEQKSSGLWFSPAPGSTAATKSAGGRVLPLGSQRFQYVVREPYEPRGKRYHLLHGVMSPKARIEVFSMMDDAALYIDGPHSSHPVKRGSRVVIENAQCPIRAVW